MLNSTATFAQITFFAAIYLENYIKKFIKFPKVYKSADNLANFTEKLQNADFNQTLKQFKIKIENKSAEEIFSKFKEVADSIEDKKGLTIAVLVGVSLFWFFIFLFECN